MLVLVPYDKPDGASGGFSFEDAGEEFYFIRLFACCGEDGLAGTAAIELLLYKFFVNRDSGRKSVNYSPNSFFMRIAETGEAEDGAKLI